MTKITMIGAGSTVFMKNLIGDALLRPSLQDAHIALMDIDPQRLAQSELVARKLVASLGAPARVEHTYQPARGTGWCRFRHRRLPDRRLQAGDTDRF